MSTYHTVELLACMLMLCAAVCGETDNAYDDVDTAKQAKEYEIKAAYIYNFLLFVEWPQTESDAETARREEEAGPSKKNIVIGIVGRYPFGQSFAKVEGKAVKPHKKRLVIRRFGRFDKQDDFAECDLLFVCGSEKRNYPKILKKVLDKPVLTVGETSGFLQAGGMLNFLSVGAKIRWEINRTPAKKARLRISVQLLRNAIRVVEIPKLAAGKTQSKRQEANLSRRKHR